MKPQDDSKALERLKEDIGRLQSKTAPKEKAPPPQGSSAALRMGMDLAAGVLVGAGFGILLDKWFGTSPVFCIVCFLLGAAGGTLTIYRTMQAMDKASGPAGPAPVSDDDDD